MRRPLPITLAIALAALAAGCTRPAVALKPPAFQQSADSLRDWESVARRIATDMQRDGFLPNPARPEATQRQAYFVKVTSPPSQFLDEVKNSLEAEILARGGAVARSRLDAAEIDLDVDVVHWLPRGRAPDGIATVAGLSSGTAVVLANQAPLVPAAGFGLLAGAGILSDILRTMTPNTDTEVAWGAKIITGNRVVFDVRYPMYIGDRDDYLYKPPKPLPPAQVVQLRYVP